MNKSVFACVICLTVVTAAYAVDWPQWRGPDGTGYVAGGNPPAEWSETENVRWKTPISGKGYASPVILGDRIFILTAVATDRSEPSAAEEDTGEQSQGRGRGSGRGRGPARPTNVHEFWVLAIDRANGEVAWRTLVNETVPHEGHHPTSTYATASPVTDGEHLIAFFGSRGLYCLDLNGEVIWSKDLGDMRTRNSFGEGASPALHGHVVVVPWDHEGDSFVAAFDKATGEELWRTPRGEQSTWATPVVTEVNGKAQAILAGNDLCIGYDLATGEEIWRTEGLTSNVTPTPIVAHGMVYLTSGFRGSALLAVRLDEARGNITGTDAIAWKHDRATPYIPSPMLAGRYLYFLGSINGILSCFDAVTGEPHYVGERLDGVSNVYASIVGAGDHVYVCGREGHIAVVENGPEFKQIASISMDEGINASPAIVGDEIYLRTDSHLYCIARTEN